MIKHSADRLGQDAPWQLNAPLARAPQDPQAARWVQPLAAKLPATPAIQAAHPFMIPAGLRFHVTPPHPRSPFPSPHPPFPSHTLVCLQEKGGLVGVESRYPRRIRTTVLGYDALQGKSQGTEEEEEMASDQVRTWV